MRNRLGDWCYYGVPTVLVGILAFLLVGMLLGVTFAPREPLAQYHATCLKHGFTELQCQYLDTKK